MSAADLADPSDLFRLVGLLGAAIYIGNYLSLALRLQNTSGTTYFATQAAAASCVMTSLVAEFNAAALVIQAFFLTTSVAAIWMRARRTGRDGRRGAVAVPGVPANSPVKPHRVRAPMRLTRAMRQRARVRLLRVDQPRLKSRAQSAEARPQSLARVRSW